MDGNNMNMDNMNNAEPQVAEPAVEAVVEPVAEVVAENTAYDYNAVENSYNYASYDEEGINTESNGLALAAMICGIAADVIYVLTYCCIFFKMIILFLVLALGIAGLVMGIIAKKKEQKKGFWLTGIICSSIIIALVCFNLVMTVLSMFLSTSIYTLPILGELMLMLGL